MDTLATAKTRYATKAYDAEKKFLKHNLKNYSKFYVSALLQ
jgi:hypothetical protein